MRKITDPHLSPHVETGIKNPRLLRKINQPLEALDVTPETKEEEKTSGKGDVLLKEVLHYSPRKIRNN